VQLLGRAKELKEYVKRGESSATVVVTLSSGNPAKPTVVTRKFMTDSKSEWKLNGACARAPRVRPQTLTASVLQACWSRRARWWRQLLS